MISMSSDDRDNDQFPDQHEDPRKRDIDGSMQGPASPGPDGVAWTGNVGGPDQPAGAGFGPGYPDPRVPIATVPENGYGRTGSGRTAIIVGTLATVVVLLIALGVWWGADRSATAGEGAPTPDKAVTRFVDAMNGELPNALDSISPAEQDHVSSLSLLALRYAPADADIGEDSVYDDIRANLERYAEVIEQTMTVDAVEEVAMTESMTAAVVTEGSISVDIVDVEGFAQITADIVTEPYSDEQLDDIFGVANTEELAKDIERELRGGETSYSRDFTEAEPLILMTVEEKGWYISLAGSVAAQTNTEYFTDADARQEFIQRNGDFTLYSPQRYRSPDEAVEQFVDALSDKPLDDAIGHLPAAEHRGLGLMLYLSAMPQIQELSFGDLVTLSHITTTTIDVSDRSALSVVSSLTLRTNPFITGQAMEIILDDGQLTVGACDPIDVSMFDRDAPLFAFSVLEDSSGWSVSLIGTIINAAAVASSAGPDMSVMDELEGCLGP